MHDSATKSPVRAAIVIPSLNPDAGLPEYCRALRKLVDIPIILVDDGSRGDLVHIFDKCAKVCEGVTTLRHEVNKGKGRALKTAFGFLLETYPDLIGCVMADSDGQHAPEDVNRCLSDFLAHPKAVTLGCREFSNASVPWKSRLGNNSMRVLFRLVTGREFLDTQTGLRAIPSEFMRQALDIKGERFEFDTNMLLELGDRELRQIKIQTIYIDGNKGTHFNPVTDSIKITGILLKRLLRQMAAFLVASILSFCVDIALFAWIFYCLFDDNVRGRLFFAVVIARVISMIFNFLCNRYIVFGESLKRHAFGRFSFLRYMALALLLLVMSYFLTKISMAVFPRVSATYVKVCVDALLFLLSFAVQRILIFRRR